MTMRLSRSSQMPPPSARERFGRQQSCFLGFELADARRREGKRDFRNRFIA